MLSLMLSAELSEGINTAKHEKLLSMCEAHIMKGAADPSALPKAVNLIHEIRLRKTQIAPVGVYYNQFAVNYIREDEDPKIINEDIQKYKAEIFAKAATEVDSFFFALPEYKELCKRANIFSESWSAIIALSQAAERRNQEAENLLK